MEEHTIIPEYSSTWAAFLAAHHALIEVLTAELENEAQIPFTWFDVLRQLSLVEGGTLRMQELSRRLLISRSGLSKLFSRIEAVGLVRREPCPGDLRGTLARLTDAGYAAVDRALPVHRRGIQHYFVDQLTEDELRTLDAVLRKIRVIAGVRQEGTSNEPDAETARREAPLLSQDGRLENDP